MFIPTENTPNPNAIKFLPGVKISPLEPVFFASAEDSLTSGLAVKLFEVQGVKAIFFGSDFITVTKEENAEWLVIKPYVLMIIMDHFTAGLEIFRKKNDEYFEDQDNLREYSDIEKEIIELLDTRIRPSVAADGGDIVFVSFSDGIVRLKLKGACAGCPSSSVTLKQGVESMLKHYIPEVESIEEVLE